MSFINRKTKKKFKSQYQERQLTAARLENYKAQFKALAIERGVETRFMGARTLTEAKKVLWDKGKRG